MSVHWPGYLAEFHGERPGVTEAVLRRATDGGTDAYAWLAAALPEGGLVVDLACGNAPLWTHVAGRPYIGLDSSAAELHATGHRGAHALVRADAAALPLPNASVPVVACSMALHILTPLHGVLSEIGRVLRPGGRLVATVPTGGPLRKRDLPMVTGLLAVLGHRLAYPNDEQMRKVGHLLEACGLRLLEDESRRYGYPLRAPVDADLLLASLYQPNLPSWRHSAARAYLRALARVHVTFPIPVRRIVARKPPNVVW